MGTRAVAVIGGGYGDEGKGLKTDYWCYYLDNPVNVRFNGGCQAGHTVVTPDGLRNVFSHIGAGAFTGAPTFLSRFFVVNPRMFRVERELFVNKFGFSPTIYIDLSCLVTTPVEMMINQILETQRGGARHGSVGVGFGETFERLKQTRYRLEMSYMLHATKDYIKTDIKKLVTEYVPMRIDVSTINDEMKEALNSDLMIDEFYDDLIYMAEHTTIADNYSMLYGRDIVFEGAQGLELDQDYGVFPYVTRSNCGMRNVTTLINELHLMGIDELLVDYVTRAYKTRHGAGPLDKEIYESFPYEDATNVHNEWQGTLRWGPFIYSKYNSITNKDFALYADEGNPYYKVARVDTMTCMDQLDNIQRRNMEKFIQASNPATFFSYGPTRDDIKTEIEI